MSAGNILVPVRGDGKGEGVLDHAVALAQCCKAHIEVVHCRARPEDMIPFGIALSDAMKRQIVESASAAANAEEGRLKGLFLEYMKTKNVDLIDGPPAPADKVTATWREETGKMAAVVAVRGRLADLIAVAQPDSNANLGYNTLESALLETGKMVLMCPPRPVTSVGKHVAIAWNGSAEAARAVTTAMPLIRNAEAVTILSAEEGLEDHLTAQDLSDHLAWHDVSAGTRVLASNGRRVSDLLLAEAKGAGADVLVMGGYGHSRRRELVMGGVTRAIIADADMPVILVH